MNDEVRKLLSMSPDELLAAFDWPTPHQMLVLALRASLIACGPPQEVHPGVYAGDNLADRLSAALTELAEEVGGAEALVAHRPGCWEAEHVRALVMEW